MAISKMEKLGPPAFKAVNVVMGICGLANVIAGTWYLAYQAEQSAGLACLGAGIALVFAATIERFELLKGLGLEAKTRQLQTTIAEAESVLAKLRRLAELTGRTTVEVTSGMGRFGSASDIEMSYRYSREIRDLLVSVGSDPGAVRHALEPWARFVAIDALGYLTVFAANERFHLATQQQVSVNPYTTYATRLERSIPRVASAEDAVGIIRQLTEIALGFDEQLRDRMVEELRIWQARLEYVTEHMDLSDKVHWFALRK